MSDCAEQVIPSGEDFWVKNEIKTFLEYEICIRNERKLNSEYVDRLLEIISEIDQMEEQWGYEKDICNTSEMIISKIQFGMKWSEAFESIAPDAKFRVEDKPRYKGFLLNTLEKYQHEIIRCINNLPRLSQFCLAGARAEGDLSSVYSWWGRVEERNSGKLKKDWIVNASKIVIKKEVDEDWGDVISKSSIDDDPFPIATPRLISTFSRLSQSEKVEELHRLYRDDAIGSSKYMKNIEFYKELDRLDSCVDCASSDCVNGNKKKSFFELIKSVLKLTKDIAGEVIGLDQVEPALVGLMCWDARKGGRTIDQAVEKVMAEISAEPFSEKGVVTHDKFKDWQGKINKKINAGRL
ncbi:Uncharacterized protein ChrSV_1074 [Chromobacterium vaccinii]|nr:Uncharacterized protein ChrSW_1074 [Chromobacterium vaccinii]QND88532.1 Uncharacterized protein ChrSV_1074 [Chromobacterium vaccinii]